MNVNKNSPNLIKIEKKETNKFGCNECSWTLLLFFRMFSISGTKGESVSMASPTSENCSGALSFDDHLICTFQGKHHNWSSGDLHFDSYRYSTVIRERKKKLKRMSDDSSSGLTGRQQQQKHPQKQNRANAIICVLHVASAEVRDLICWWQLGQIRVDGRFPKLGAITDKNSLWRFG